MTRLQGLVVLACLTGFLMGAGVPLGAQDEAESGYDRVWAKTELYRGGSGSFFQSVRLSGRLQMDLAYVDSGDDDHGEFNVRRFRTTALRLSW